MQEHSNLYHIFLKDQQAHPMDIARVVQVLVLILQKYENIYQSGH
jgi:hypothetical protein